VKFTSLTPAAAAYHMPVLPDVHILNGKNTFWSVYMDSYNKFT